ncbi:MAG TPA: WG repeat-containing protein [Prolixibacteraceae bacterium]|nr:WG repeat-containing protein [Prolixibacteraceae bacterium]
MKTQFRNDYSLEISAVNNVIDCWVYALEPEPVVSLNQGFIPFCEYQNWLGNIITDHFYQEANSFSQGLAVVGSFPIVTDEEIELWGGINLSEVKYGFINREGKEKIPLIYDDASDFEGGLARVCLGYKRGFIDRNGNWVKDE